MPVGTLGSVKRSQSGKLMQDIRLQFLVIPIIFYLRRRTGSVAGRMPGGTPVYQLEKPILTDSGGYQIFLCGNAKIKPEGVVSIAY